MKKIVTSSLAILLSAIISFGSVTVLAAQSDSHSGVCGDALSWTLNSETGLLTVSGSGAMDDYPATSIPWRAVRSEIKNVEIGNNVTEICSFAFYDCPNLETVNIPKSIAKIGTSAFSQSLSLTKITVDSDNANFESDENGVLFTKGMSELIQYPVGSENTNYSVPDSVTEIYADAFRHSEKLSGILLSEKLEAIGEEAFYASGIKSINIPSSVSEIGKDAFGWCFSLEIISVDEANASYSSDEAGVLFDKSKTELIKFPNGNKKTSYDIPEGTAKLADNSFENCYNLSSVKIPASVVSIGSGVFFNCYLKTITVEKSNQNYSNDEYGVLFTKDKTELIQYPIRNGKSAYIIPEGVQTIKENAFRNCQILERIVVAESVETIGKEAFALCGSLEYVHIPGTVTEAGDDIITNGAYICSESENSFAKEYADSNGITFKACENHAVTGITLSETNIEITNKQSHQLTATVTPDSAAEKSIEWTSDNTAVAVVDENGIITAISAGKATITAKADGGYTASCNVTVNPRYFSITWNVDGNENVQSVAEDTKIIAPSAPDKTGYSFKGWTPSVPDTMPAENLSFNATWETNSYNAVFNANGGAWTDGSTQKIHPVEYNTKIYLPRNPAKQGYIFEGWTPETGIMDNINGKEFSAVWSAATDTKYTVKTYTMETDGTYTESVQILAGTTDTTAEALYTPETGFELNTEKSVLSGNIAADGSLVLKVYFDRTKFSATINGKNVEYLYGSKIAEPPKPETPKGHTQEGWVDENGNALEFPITVNDMLPCEIKPNFVRNSYTVTWTVDGETTTETYKYEDTIIIPADPEKTGYTFIGWTPEIPDTVPDSNLEFGAVWSVNSYNAAFDANGGAWADGSDKITVSVPFDSEISAPDAPEKLGYIFAGWTPEIGIMDDINGKIFKAVWIASTETTYTVETYTMTTDGSYSAVTQVFTGTTDSTVNAQYAVGTGFVLNTEKSVLSGTVYADNSLVLKAYIDRLSFTITTIADGTEATESYLYGAVISEFVKPVKEGYTFIGWDKEIPDTMPAENLVFNAIFEKNKYTCPDCGEIYDDESEYNEHTAYEQAKKNVRISIENNPGSKTIKYGETLRLTAVVSGSIPTEVYWYVDDVKSGEGTIFDVKFESGTKTVRAEVVDSEGNTLKDINGNIISDSEKVSVDSGFFQKIISFFKNLFRINRIIEQ